MAGACATDTDPGNDGACLDAFIQKLGGRALRRPLESDELAFYRRLHGASATPSSAAGYADVIAGLLTAPQFLYHVEHGAAAVPGRTAAFALSAHELASRLSYHFWETMPDGRCWPPPAPARSPPPGYRAQVDRLFGDARTRPAIESFLRDWLKLDDMAPLDARNADPVFRAFAAADLPRASLQGEMIEDVLGMARHTTWNAGTFDDLLLGERSFARGADLARLYGVAAWDGTSGRPPSPPASAPGLFTRAAFLATGSPTTRPVDEGGVPAPQRPVRRDPAPTRQRHGELPRAGPGPVHAPGGEEDHRGPGQLLRRLPRPLHQPHRLRHRGLRCSGPGAHQPAIVRRRRPRADRAPVDTRSVPQIIDGDSPPPPAPLT